jgi:hypothetical protein
VEGVIDCHGRWVSSLLALWRRAVVELDSAVLLPLWPGCEKEATVSSFVRFILGTIVGWVVFDLLVRWE